MLAQVVKADNMRRIIDKGKLYNNKAVLIAANTAGKITVDTNKQVNSTCVVSLINFTFKNKNQS